MKKVLKEKWKDFSRRKACLLVLQPAGLGKQRMKEGKRNPPTNWNGNARNVQCQTTQWHREIQCSMSNKYNTVTEKNTICNAKQMQYGLNEMKTNLFIQKSEKQSLLSWYWYETRTDDNLDHNQWQAILKLTCTISTAAEFLLSVHKIHDQGS